MNSLLRIQQRNLEELTEIMKDDPMRIVSVWKKKSPNVSIRYYYEKSYIFNEVKIMAKIVITSNTLTTHRELFFSTVVGNKKSIRSLSQNARREAALDLVHCSKLLVADKPFQTYITTEEFLFPSKPKRKYVDIPHKRRIRPRTLDDFSPEEPTLDDSTFDEPTQNDSTFDEHTLDESTKEELSYEAEMCEMFEEMHVIEN